MRTMLQPGDRMTGFELPDLAGRAWTQENFRGRLTILFFFSSW